MKFSIKSKSFLVLCGIFGSSVMAADLVFKDNFMPEAKYPLELKKYASILSLTKTARALMVTAQVNHKNLNLKFNPVIYHGENYAQKVQDLYKIFSTQKNINIYSCLYTSTKKKLDESSRTCQVETSLKLGRPCRAQENDCTENDKMVANECDIHSLNDLKEYASSSLNLVPATFYSIESKEAHYCQYEPEDY